MGLITPSVCDLDSSHHYLQSDWWITARVANVLLFSPVCVLGTTAGSVGFLRLPATCGSVLEHRKSVVVLH